MAIVVSRTESGMSLTTSFAALDNLAGASVSSSFTVPQGVSGIKQVSISMSNDAAEETIGLLKIKFKVLHCYCYSISNSIYRNRIR